MDTMTKMKKSDKKKSRCKQIELKTVFTAKNAERERSRVKSLRNAFQSLQSCLPSVPPNTKLSKLDILILATNYISHLTKLLSTDEENQVNCQTASDCNVKYLHPIKKWPMRSRLYLEATDITTSSTVTLYSSPNYPYELDSTGFQNNFSSFM